jgi:ammonia channel protein AmtB
MLELARLLLSMSGFLMPIGLMLMVSGRVRIKNEVDTLVRILSASIIALVLYWLVGYGLSSTPSFAGLFGLGGFAFGKEELLRDAGQIENVLLFIIPAVTIASATAERGAFGPTNLLVALVSILVTPFVMHWAWASDDSGQGWLLANNFNDEGGAVVIFTSAAFAALATSIVIGPRSGRFPMRMNKARGHSPTIHFIGLIFAAAGLGTMQAAVAASPEQMRFILFNITLGAVFSVLAALLLFFICRSRSSAMDLLNASLAGTIAITVFASHTTLANAGLAGMFAGAVTIGLRRMFQAMEIDDQTDLIAIFMAAGIVGGLSDPVFGPHPDLSLIEAVVAQLLGWISIGLWAFVVTILIAYGLDKSIGLRASEADELRGLSRSYFGFQSEPDYLLSIIMHQPGGALTHTKPSSEELGRLTNRFSEPMVQLRTEMHRSIDNLQTLKAGGGLDASLITRMRLAEDTLMVKAEDMLLLLERIFTSDGIKNEGIAFRSWLVRALDILIQPTLQELARLTRSVPLQVDANELERIVLAASDSVTRCAHLVELIGDFAEAGGQGFFSAGHHCDMAKLFDEQMPLLQALAEISNSPVQIDRSINKGTLVEGDANAIARIFNLVVEGALNRLHRQKNDPIRLELREHSAGHHVVFDCLDTGTALSARQIRAITKPLSEDIDLQNIGLAQILPLILATRLIEVIDGEFTISSEHGIGTLLHCRFRKIAHQSKEAA